MNDQKPIALVTGGNRGIGFDVCRQLAKKGITVILTSRDSAKGIQKAAELESEGLDVIFAQLDVNDPDSIAEIQKFVEKKWGRLDILVNNAAILLDDPAVESKHPSGLFETDKEILMQTFETNVVGCFMLSEAFLPMMIQQNYGRIVNITSGLSQLEQMQSDFPAYRISKTALNAVTRIFADKGRKHHVLVNSIDPGWVKTDMGGPNAPLTVEQAADTIVWASTLPNDGPTGGFFREKMAINW